jgi:NTP pyrophosphatase (non-canonical NTP hydrolase)
MVRTSAFQADNPGSNPGRRTPLIYTFENKIIMVLMAAISKKTTIKEYQNFVESVYGLPNERHYSLWDMLSNAERFTMRSLKGIRKRDYRKANFNLLISLSWLISILNRLHIDLEEAVWKRFPYMCSYCASCPCICKEEKINNRKSVVAGDTRKPVTLDDFQSMFREIYPPEKRTLEHAGIHLAEEFGEFSESILAYMGGHKDDRFDQIVSESADIFSCVVSVFNSLDLNMAEELSLLFSDNCHVCHKEPCECNFSSVINFES